MREQAKAKLRLMFDAADKGEVKPEDMAKAMGLLAISSKTMYRALKELPVTVHTVGPIHDRYRVWRRPAGGW
jgi:hypothetical protein